MFVHLVTPPRWRRITGEAPPPPPVDRADTRAGLPWCDYHDADAEGLSPTPALEGASRSASGSGTAWSRGGRRPPAR
ncbi:hypothetical protein [Streptomyces olivaceoviridis]